MVQRMTLLTTLALAALVLAACGGAAVAPDATQPAATAMDIGSSAEMPEEDAAPVTAEDPDAMAKEEPGATAAAEADEMVKDGGAAEEAGEMVEDDSAAVMAEKSDPMTESESSGSMDPEPAETSSEADSTRDKEAMMDLPAWFSAELTDVNSGERLTVSGLEGKVVLVETMAIWCSNCLRQQQEVKALHEAPGTEDGLVTLVLDIDPNENADHLRDYAARNGFDWLYAVAPREVAREIGQLYGDQFLNPPSTPMLIVDRDGEVHPLPFGRKSAQDLQGALAPFLSEGM